MLSPDLQLILQKSTERALNDQHEFVTLEHFLEQFCLSSEGQDFFGWAGVNMQSILIEVQDLITQHNTHPNSSSSPEPTVALHRALNRALSQAQSAGKSTISGCHVLIATFDEDDSFVPYILEKNGIDTLVLMDYLSQSADAGPQESYVEKYAVLLNSQLKNSPQKLIGREEDLKALHRTLLRKHKNHALIVGDTGVGKTAFVLGFVQKLIEGKVPKTLKKAQVYSLQMGPLLAGTKYRGDLESRIDGLFKELKVFESPIVFIDEIHNLVGAGRTTGSSSDLSNLIKPYLEKNKIRFIGATTPAEMRKHLDSEPAFVRRFQRLDLDEPSHEECQKIVEGLIQDYEIHHKITYTEEAIASAIDLSGKHLHERKWPDKALDVIDESGSMAQLLGETEVDRKIVEKVVSRMAKIPEETAETSELDVLKDLDARLKKKVFGQNEAVDKLVAAIQFSRSGLGPLQGPIASFLFTGPTGVGKTEVSKQLAEQLGIHFMKFDMSEYMEKHSVAKLIGAPPGYVGYDEGGQMTTAIRANPHSIVLLDEIEKAHPDLLNILLQVMDSGRLTDSKGLSVNFSNAIIIMTSNLGAREAAKNVLGFHQASSTQFSDEAVKKFFSPEFINRLTGIIKFGSLPKQQLLDVIEKFMQELKTQVQNKGFDLKWKPEVLEWIFNKGYDPLMGARPFARTINEYVKPLLVAPLLFSAQSGTTSSSASKNKKRKVLELKVKDDTQLELV